MPPYRIFLVDDNVEFLESAEHFLAAEPWAEIVGCALSGRAALRQIAGLRPDLVLMDLVMPEMDGLETTRHLKSQPDGPRVVLMTLNDIPAYRTAAFAAGADGFLPKSEFGAQLLPLIRTLFSVPDMVHG